MKQRTPETHNNHYVDRNKLNSELAKWVAEYHSAVAAGQPKPRLTEYLGECIILIANKSANMPGFVNYPFKDEMIDDAIEICLRYIHNYDENAISKRTGKKTAGAFGYITQTACSAFIKRIKQEKHLMYLRQKYIAQSWDMFVDIQEHDAENFTEELKEILQEMSGDEYKEYDAKILEKRNKLASERQIREVIGSELQSDLDNIEDSGIIDYELSTNDVLKIAEAIGDDDLVDDIMKQFFE